MNFIPPIGIGTKTTCICGLGLNDERAMVDHIIRHPEHQILVQFKGLLGAKNFILTVAKMEYPNIELNAVEVK